MAQDDLIQALLSGLGAGGGGATSGSADINAFNKTVQANDIYRQIADPLLAMKFDTSTWSPGETLAANSGKAFLGSILSAIGQRDEEAQLAKVADVLPALYANPAAAKVPAGVDPTAFQTLKMNAIQKKAIQDAELEDAKSRLFAQIGGTMDPSGKLQEIPGWADLLSKKEDIQNRASESMQLRAKTALEKDYYNRITKLPAYDSIAKLGPEFAALPDLITQDTISSDIGLITAAAKIRDERSSVREGEYNIGTDIQSYFDKVAGNWRAVVGGKSRLTPTARQELIASLTPKYNAVVSAYEEQKSPLLEALARQGGNPLNVAVPTYKSFSMDSIKDIPAHQTPTAEFIAAAKAAGLTKDQARQKWMEQNK